MNKKQVFKIKIGLELHSQIYSNSKLFSYSPNYLYHNTNSNISLFDLGIPGTLPLTNSEIIKNVLKVSIILSSKINKFIIFDRKNYFYPDLSQGYQITQFFYPISVYGNIHLNFLQYKKNINIHRIHLEQDAARIIYDTDLSSILIDFNRLGIPLVEIVTEPDFNTFLEVEKFINTIKIILKYCNISNSSFENGSIRCDINISLKSHSAIKYHKIEIKNLNSIKSIKNAINYEIFRQGKFSYRSISQETRFYSDKLKKTIFMRSKDDCKDYRYFNDPDLLPLNISNIFIINIKKSIPKLPYLKLNDYINKYNLTYNQSLLISNNRFISYLFEYLSLIFNSKFVFNWISTDLLYILNKKKIVFSRILYFKFKIKELLLLLFKKDISRNISKKILLILFDTDYDICYIVKKFNFYQVSDDSTIKKYINKVINNYRNEVLNYKNGNIKLLKFFIGRVLYLSKGRADPIKIKKLLLSLL